MGWDIFGNVTLQNDGPFERNPHYVRLVDPGHAHKRTGIANEGFSVSDSKPMKNIVLPYGQEEKTRKYE